MNIQKQIVKFEQYEVQHRSAFTRSLALFLAAATVLSSIEMLHGDEKRRSHETNKEAIVAQAAQFDQSEKTERNETVRMPVKFDDGLRATATTTF